ncbi:MAG: PASTA domain-containing protein [Clostridia bacterium]|nr:PASTA domain-containing protein [Clostridia bacterium]MBQ8370098.1 PASTA domain-containing protein [Clostridia bacterium]
MNVRNRTDRKTSRKIIAIFVIFTAVACVIVGRLANYQIKMHDYYESIVLNQLTIQTEVTPERGNILDRNGNILATNKTVYNVILSPADIIAKMKDNEELADDSDPENDVRYDYTDPEYEIYYNGTELDELIAEVLAGYLDVDESTILEKAGKTGRYYEVVKKNVDASLAEKIETFIAQFSLKKEVYFEASSKRYYPKSDLASHVIGFTNSEGVGIYGLESYYNNLLEGTSGRYILAQDAKRQDMPFEYERYIEAENGYNIVTTLDIYIQYELENQLKKTYLESGAGDRVTGIVMDVNTGGVLAMATYPSFDLNDPYTIDEYSQAELDALGYAKGSEDYTEKYTELMYRMWNNKAITETYEPGSTFKIITTAMAFEEGVVTPETPFYCSGSLMVEGWSKPISCHLHTGHGAVTFRVGLQQSCNPTLMQIAAGVGRAKFYEYFQAFGYTAKTGVDLPGEVGGIYSAYKNFSGVSLAVYSFGQTFKTTALQQLRAISSVANGGYLITPHLLKEIVDDDGNVIQSYETEQVRQVVSTEVCETITEILEEGVAGDGGAKNAYVKGYRVAAKTGTSEKRDEVDEFGNTPYRVGSTAAYAPADDPQVSAIIIVDKPLKSAVYGSVVAAPYISNLMGYVLPYIGVEAQYTTEELAALDVTLSNYVGATVEAAVTDLSWRNFTYEIIGDGTTVTAQIPEAGSKISSDTGLLILYTGEETPAASVTVPDLTGMTAFNANNAVIGAGLNVIFTGSTNGTTAVVVNQTPAAGARVARGTIVEIELRHMDGTD